MIKSMLLLARQLIECLEWDDTECCSSRIGQKEFHVQYMIFCLKTIGEQCLMY
jgi:hypothetical protein